MTFQSVLDTFKTAKTAVATEQSTFDGIVVGSAPVLASYPSGILKRGGIESLIAVGDCVTEAKSCFDHTTKIAARNIASSALATVKNTAGYDAALNFARLEMPKLSAAILAESNATAKAALVTTHSEYKTVLGEFGKDLAGNWL